MRLISGPLFWRPQIAFAFLCVVTLACSSLSSKDDSSNEQKSSTSDESGDEESGSKSEDDQDSEQSLAASFVEPSEEAQSPGKNGEVAVKVQFEQAADDATWDLYYTAAEDTLTPPTKVFSARPATGNTYDWDTASVPSGEYKLQLILHSDGKQVGATSSGTIAVGSSGDGNVSPRLSLNGIWTGGGAVTKSSNVEIDYDAFDADSDPVSLKIELSSDGGQSYRTITTGHSDLNTYVWDLAGEDNVPEGTNYRIRITATDGNGGETVAESSSSFGIAANDYTYDGTIRNILMQCGGSSCHDTGTSNNLASAFIWDQFETADDTGAGQTSDRIVARLKEGTMPPSSTIPAEDELDVELWHLLGAPQN